MHTKPTARASIINEQMSKWSIEQIFFNSKETPLSQTKCHVGLNHYKTMIPHHQREGEGQEKYTM